MSPSLQHFPHSVTDGQRKLIVENTICLQKKVVADNRINWHNNDTFFWLFRLVNHSNKNYLIKSLIHVHSNMKQISLHGFQERSEDLPLPPTDTHNQPPSHSFTPTHTHTHTHIKNTLRVCVWIWSTKVVTSSAYIQYTVCQCFNNFFVIIIVYTYMIKP